MTFFPAPSHAKTLEFQDSCWSSGNSVEERIFKNRTMLTQSDYSTEVMHTVNIFQIKILLFRVHTEISPFKSLKIPSTLVSDGT
jgi:hypothetical protein